MESFYYLEPRYSSQKSFYKKAKVFRTSPESSWLQSYNTRVAEIQNGVPLVHGTYSNTTLKHIKEYLLQNGFRAENKAQIVKDYMDHVNIG